MEGISMKKVAVSNPFRFFVGPDKREFTIHSALVAHQSPALEALVYGKFKEATDCSVEWDEIDEKTFVSFWQYVYTGDYDTPKPLSTTTLNIIASSTNSEKHAETNQFDAQPVEDIRADEPALEPEPVPAEPEPAMDDVWGFPRKEKKKKRRAKRDMLWSDFQESWRLDLSVHVSDETCEIEKTSKDHGEIFIHHARVYVLGDRYGVTRLMNESFRKLHQALVGYDVAKEGVSEVVALLQFCYTELVPERLRQLVIHYSSCKVETLWKNEEFEEFLEEYGSLSRALVGSMLLRLD
ncbi:hypothetical protein C8A00DRAFT_40656 [Chaetomidium leptoderma]|uniref:BTB domain-containing protein n=1 Tax=Chaetomidium leptoderma TaxID=669021 RepID=A0AAN7A0H6_9PEZI|nr:hypothetical protein C8A00DRAFT_40656 [Chaetomidium leptoderma]